MVVPTRPSMRKRPLKLVIFLVFVVTSATAQQDTFNGQTQPLPIDPSDVFSSSDCRTNPSQALQQWQNYYQVMLGVIARRDQEESQGYQSQISSEQNPDIRASIKAHYDYEVNVVDAIWRLNTASADKCVRNYILSGCNGTLNCPVKPTPPFKEPTFPPSSQPSPGVAKTTCGKFTAIVQSCPRGGPGSHGPLPGTGGIVGPACIMCFWRDANGYPAVHPQIIPAPGFIKSEYDPPGAAVKECGDRLKPGWVAERGLLCPTSRGDGGQGESPMASKPSAQPVRPACPQPTAQPVRPDCPQPPAQPVRPDCPRPPPLDTKACWYGLRPGSGKLCAENGQFWEENGRVVILRGMNVAGASKVPPFLPLPTSADTSFPAGSLGASQFNYVSRTNVRELDHLQNWGLNVIRLLFVWEAYEPEPGMRNDSYLQMLSMIASEASKRGIYTIIDFHQDAFSRWLASGCGEGFPRWALAAWLRTTTPRNDSSCKMWMQTAMTDRSVHMAFSDFYSERAPQRLRSRYVGLLGYLAARFRGVPGVIGFDLLNEPFADAFDNELASLYQDAGGAVFHSDPTAILFLEPDLMTDFYGGAHLPQPFDTWKNVAYAPHYYDAQITTGLGYSKDFSDFMKRLNIPVARPEEAFRLMRESANNWHTPLFLGEFGAPVDAKGVASYIALLYDLLDGGKVPGAQPASGAQWSYTPGWTPDRLDGWNQENLSIVDNRGLRTQLFFPRAYAQQVSGIPTKQAVGNNFIHLEWINQPRRSNQTVIFVPSNRPITPANINTFGTPPEELSCHFAGNQRVVCSSGCWQKSLRVTITYSP